METSNLGIWLMLGEVEVEVGSFSLIFPRVKKGISARRVIIRYVICFYTNHTYTLQVLVCLQCKIRSVWVLLKPLQPHIRCVPNCENC